MIVSSRGILLVSLTMALSILLFPALGLTLFLLMHLMQSMVVHGHCKSEQSLIALFTCVHLRVKPINSMESCGGGIDLLLHIRQCRGVDAAVVSLFFLVMGTYFTRIIRTSHTTHLCL